jgi:hypothetical protein
MADTGIDALETTLRLLQVQQLARRGKLREAIEAVAPGGVPPRSACCRPSLRS